MAERLRRRRRSTAPLTLSLIALLGIAAGCGDDGGGSGDDAAGTTTAAEATSAPTNASSEPTTAPDGDVDDDDDDDVDDDDDDLCSVVDTTTVAEATGQEVLDATSTTGTGEVQGVGYQTVGCRYQVAPEGELEVQVLVDATGAPATAEVHTALEEASLGLTPSDDFPHEDVAGLGTSAFFLNSLLSNQLFVDTGSSVLLVEGELGDEEAPRAMLVDLAGAAVGVLG
jgi:hypothetical protein